VNEEIKFVDGYPEMSEMPWLDRRGGPSGRYLRTAANGLRR
jgi:hypothetical protein